MKRKLMLLMACIVMGIGLVNAQISKVTGTVIWFFFNLVEKYMFHR